MDVCERLEHVYDYFRSALELKHFHTNPCLTTALCTKAELEREARSILKYAASLFLVGPEHEKTRSREVSYR